MTNRQRARILAVALNLAAAPASAADRDPDAVHAATLVIDAHADVKLPPDGTAKPGETVDTGSQVSIEKLRTGGVGAIVLAAFVPTGPRSSEGYAAAHTALDAKIAAIKAIAARHPREAALARTPDDIRRIAASGRTAILLGFLNAYSLGAEPDGIARMYRAGVRVLGLAHRGNNDFADSSRLLPQDTPGEHHGLSPRGRAAVAEMNRLGILVDVSQLTHDGLLQSVALSRSPVIASHADVRALVENPRNLTDDELRAIAAKGGVVGINAFPAYLHRLTPPEHARIATAAAKVGGNPMDGIRMADAPTHQFLREVGDVYKAGTSVADLVDQIDYTVKLIGIDHVAISSDFNHGGGIIGWQNESEAPNVTAELVRRGYSDADIGKLWGGNFLRVLAAAQAGAHG